MSLSAGAAPADMHPAITDRKIPKHSIVLDDMPIGETNANVLSTTMVLHARRRRVCVVMCTWIANLDGGVNGDHAAYLCVATLSVCVCCLFHKMKKGQVCVF